MIIWRTWVGGNLPVSEEERKVLLEEYVQGNETVRENTKLCWTIFAIFFPVSFGLLGLSYTIKDVSLGSLIILAVASTILYIMWMLVDRRFTWFTSVHYKRLQNIEGILGMRLHIEVHERDKGIEPDPTRKWRWPIRIFLYWSVVGLASLWVLRIAFFVYGL